MGGRHPILAFALRIMSVSGMQTSAGEPLGSLFSVKIDHFLYRDYYLKINR